MDIVMVVPYNCDTKNSYVLMRLGPCIILKFLRL